MGQIGCIGHDGDCCKTREQDLKDAERYRRLREIWDSEDGEIGLDYLMNLADADALDVALDAMTSITD